jgi:hypothetical protein
LEKGADTEIRDEKGMKAVDYAKDQVMIDLLNSFGATADQAWPKKQDCLNNWKIFRRQEIKTRVLNVFETLIF